MIALSPLETLFDAAPGAEIALPPELARLYGTLALPIGSADPHIIGNFVSTLDGVVSLNIPGQSGGREISGFNQHDRLVMGILRAVADAVVVGAGTLRAVPHHLWTAEHVYPALADAFAHVRATIGKPGPPLNVVVTARGEIDLELPVFASGQVPALIVTTEQGSRRLGDRPLPRSVAVTAVGSRERITAQQVVHAIAAARPSSLILVEGGPTLFGDFLDERCLDELFLTLAPQVAGRNDASVRPGLVAGRNFAPDDPRWGTLVAVKRAHEHLFLRYAFPKVTPG